MKRITIVQLLLSLAFMTQAQIKNVIEKDTYAQIELEPEYYQNVSPRDINIRDGYVAGWNAKIVVIAEHVSDQGGGTLYIYDHRGSILSNGSLRLENIKNAKISVNANSIVITRNGTSRYFDLKGQPK